MSGYKVGINYFSGWWRKAPNKYTPRGSDWRTMPEFSGRCALLGMYNDALTVDAEIIAASKYGVDFFQFLWYGRYADCPERDMGLDSGLHHFCSSQEAQRMEFCVEYCNHPPFGITDDKLWDTCCEEWIDRNRVVIGGDQPERGRGALALADEVDSGPCQRRFEGKEKASVLLPLRV